MKVFELIFYPVLGGCCISHIYNTMADAIICYRHLQAKYPNRSGDAFIRVLEKFSDTFSFPLYNISVE